MPRGMRVKSETGIYHVMLRGINQQLIFNDEEDKEKFLEILKECKAISVFEIYAYCLMNNHVHILLKEGKEELGQIIKRIGVRYVYWYNWKYYRRGHLFQDRYKSEPVNDEKYLFTVLRYIHQNPLKAGIVKEIDEYEYSSYNEYLNKSTSDLIDKEFIFEMIDIEGFKQYNNEITDEKCMEYDYSDFKITDKEAKEIIYKVSKCESAEDFLLLEKEKRDKYIKELKNKGLSIRQIGRLTGISFGIVRRI